MRFIIGFCLLFNVMTTTQDFRLFKGSTLSVTDFNLTMQICSSQRLHFHFVQQDDFVHRFSTENTKCNEYKMLITENHQVSIFKNKKVIRNFTNLDLKKICFNSFCNDTFWKIYNEPTKKKKNHKWTFEVDCSSPTCVELDCRSSNCEDFSIRSRSNFGELHDSSDEEMFLFLYKYRNQMYLIFAGLLIFFCLIFIVFKKLEGSSTILVDSII